MINWVDSIKILASLYLGLKFYELLRALWFCTLERDVLTS
jgi:hypothetical protein